MNADIAPTGTSRSSAGIESHPHNGEAHSANATATNGKLSALEVALRYLDRGWCPIPVFPGRKKPKDEKWQELRLTREQLPLVFVDGINVGIVLGGPSNLLIDVDLDHMLAVELAPDYLPLTGAIFGRSSNQRSHWLYRLKREAATKKFAFPNSSPKRELDKKMIVELRSTGLQTVFPGSVHVSGEPIEWASDGEPALVDPDELLKCIKRLADDVMRRLDYEKKQKKPTSRAVGQHSTLPASEIMDRARKYLAKIPPAISGNGGHNTTFQAACQIVQGFNLDREQALLLLTEWNQSCDPPWSEKELEHKVDDALKGEGKRGYLLGDPATLDLREPAGRTDVANSRRLVALHGDKLRWCDPWDKWLVWDRWRWSIDQARRAEALAKDAADEIWKSTFALFSVVDKDLALDLVRFSKATASARGISNMMSLARCEDVIAILPDALDAHPWLLNCANGIVDLQTGQLLPHDPQRYLTKLVPHDYVPAAEAESPLWNKFLATVFAKNENMIGFVQRLFGSALVGQVVEHILPILYGTGANGKSVLVETMLHVFGDDYACKAASDLLLAKRNDSHPTERADLFGKRLVACVETDENRRLAEGLVKEITGGDTIKARRMREDFWSFKPSHTAILITNHKPEVRGTDNGIWRRLRLVPFTVTIPDADQDKQLTEKLKAEARGILRWCVEGCLAWQREGLGEPNEVTTATHEYRGAMDVLATFISECCILSPESKIRSDELFRAYTSWCESHGESAKSARKLGEAMTERDFERFTSNGTWYRGVGLLGESTRPCEM